VNNYLYVANYASNTVSVIDPSTNIIVATVTGFSYPTGVAFNPSNGDIYVANQGGGVKVIGPSNTIIATVSVSGSPWGVQYDPSNQYLYVTCGSTVSVINSANSVVTTISGFSQAQRLMYNPLNHDIYIVNGGSGAISRVSSSTNTIVGTINVPAIGLAFDPANNDIYANEASGLIAIISTS
jgi:YVTN family beta-propeller protein